MASKVTLRTREGEEFVVDETVAMQSETLKHMIQDGCAADVIPVTNVDGKTLAKILEYAEKHGASAAAEEEDERGMKKWDAEFINVDMDTLYDLLTGANYLDVKGLLDLCVQKVANMIKGKSVAEIRETFDITNDFTPEEEQKIRAEHEWAFEDEK